MDGKFSHGVLKLVSMAVVLLWFLLRLVLNAVQLYDRPPNGGPT